MRGLRAAPFAALLLLCAAAPPTAGAAGLTFRLGGAESEHAADVAVDADGNLYLAGAFRHRVDFDPGPETHEIAARGTPEPDQPADITELDGFVAKYDPSGALVWVLALGGPGTDVAQCVCVDKSGAVFVGGQFSREIDFDPSDPPDDEDTLRTGSGRNAFLVKYAADGSFLWVRGFGDEDIASKAMSRLAVEWSEGIRNLAVDEAGNVYATGLFAGVIDLDPGAGHDERKSTAGGVDFFVVCLGPDASYRWGFTLGGQGEDWCKALALGPNDRLVIGGMFSGEVDFDPGPGEETAAADGKDDAFLAWFDRKGALQHLATWGGYGMDVVSQGALVVDRHGVVHAAGEFKGKTDFAPGKRKVLGFSKGGTDAFLVRVDAAGRLERAFTLGGAGTDSIHAVCLDAAGNVVVTGRFQKRVDFAPGRRKVVLEAQGTGATSSAFVASYTPKGKLRWVHTLGAHLRGRVSLTRGTGIALCPDGRLVVFGIFFGTIDVAPGRRKLLLESAGKADLFVVRYDADGGLVP